MKNRIETAVRLREIESAGTGWALWSDKAYEDELQNPDSKFFTLSNHGRPLDAFVFYRTVDTEAWIMQIAVEHKRQGRGSELMRAFLAELKTLGFTEVGLEVASGNTSAVRLYEKFGFKKIGERKAYYRNGDSAWVLKLQL